MSPTGRSRSRSFSNLQRALSGGTGFGVTDGGDEQQHHAAGEKPHSLWDQTFQDGTMARVIDKEMRAKRTHAQALVAASAIYHDRVNDHFSRTAVEELIPETSTARRKGLHRLDLGELAGAAMAGGATAEQIHDAVTGAEEQRSELIKQLAGILANVAVLTALLVAYTKYQPFLSAWKHPIKRLMLFTSLMLSVLSFFSTAAIEAKRSSSGNSASLNGFVHFMTWLVLALVFATVGRLCHSFWAEVIQEAVRERELQAIDAEKDKLNAVIDAT